MTVQVQQAESGTNSFFDGLLGGTSRLEGFPQVQVAKTMCIGSLMISVGDLVARGRDAGVVVACALEGETLMLIVDSLLKVADVTANAVRLRSSGELAVWRAAEARGCLAWRCEPDGSTLLLMM